MFICNLGGKQQSTGVREQFRVEGKTNVEESSWKQMRKNEMEKYKHEEQQLSG